MTEIAKAYDPELVELKWSRAWIDADAFRGLPDESNEAFCIVLPPPNVTGVLHMGHVLNGTIQDILVRRARQEGKKVLWLPGTDHASIATHARIERELRKEGKTRYDLGREAFLKRAWQWSDEHRGIILNQLKKLGASCDWSRTVFTMDEAYSRAVLTAFVLLYERGYIYRGNYMGKWCPVSLTALSDEEVIMKPQKGLLYKMRYELVEDPGKFLEISTTRPETLMGDTAVAVHPEDSRYQHLIGKHAWRPFPRAELPIIGDAAVDREFGTGVLKVTPAHDEMDFQIGQRHNLPVIDVFNPDASLNELAGEDFIGVDRFEARKIAVEKLKAMDLYVGDEQYENNIGFSERADVPIEPRISDQWWMRYPKVEEAITAYKERIIQFHPDRWGKVYLHWLENIRDWCISRQLWWGHRIPVWYKKETDRNNPENWHVSVDGPPDPENWEQEEDMLDTWLSSWLWPFATMGWPDPNNNESDDLNFFYPTYALVTGPDIIFFWVSRMIMAGLEFMGPKKKKLTPEEIKKRIPFQNVYFTGMIRDLQGRKMSKSLGNSPDPLDLIDKFGADGLRYGIMSIAPKGQDILFSEERIEQGRNYCNKLWNACRFRQLSGKLEDNASPDKILSRFEPDKFDEYDHWIVNQLIKTVHQIEKCFDNYDFYLMAQSLYSLFWSDYCDWYLEVSKSKLKNESLRDNCLTIQDFILRQVLLTIHPFIPFITEELWHELGYGDNELFIEDHRLESSSQLQKQIAEYGIDEEAHLIAANKIDELQLFVMHARYLKAEYNVANKRDVKFYYTVDEEHRELVASHNDNIKHLVGASEINPCNAQPQGAPAKITPMGTIYLDLASAVDVATEKERLNKELMRLEKQIAGSEARLADENFLKKAPEKVIQGARDQLATNKTKREEFQKLINNLG